MPSMTEHNVFGGKRVGHVFLRQMDTEEVQVVLFLVNYVGETGIIHHFSTMIMMMMARLMMIEIHNAAVGIMFLVTNVPNQNVSL